MNKRATNAYVCIVRQNSDVRQNETQWFPSADIPGPTRVFPQ